MKIECTICSENIKSSEDVTATPCGHMFHRQCITRWMRVSLPSHCPSCRTVCREGKLIPLYINANLNDTRRSLSLTVIEELVQQRLDTIHQTDTATNRDNFERDEELVILRSIVEENQQIVNTLMDQNSALLDEINSMKHEARRLSKTLTRRFNTLTLTEE